MNINFTNASFAKNDFLILKDINISLIKGKSYAVLGSMGSGKTTFLQAIAGKVFPKSGSISKPKSIEFVASDYKFHRYIGPVYQYYQQRYHAYDSEIGPTLYEVLQNQVKPMGTIDDKSVELDDPLYSEEHLLKVCKLLRLDSFLDRKITSLSTGETRRSLLALSILKNPDVLLLDNPYVGLDKETRSMLNNILEELAKVNKVSLILVCGLADLPAFIDEVLVLEKGEIKGKYQRNDLPEFLYNQAEITVDENIINKLKEGQYQDFNKAVSFSNAIVKYGDKYALKDFNWEVKKGEKWALMGPNGSGKSTVLSLITADNPQAYRNKFELFDRKRGTGESIWDIKKNIGFVSAELQQYLEKGIPVWKLVASGLFETAGLYQELNDGQLKTVFDYINLIGIQDIAERPIDQLSNGEKRLAFLARALVKNPPLLILDEPCQGLDYNQMTHFRNILDTIVKAFDKTLIYVTHYEDELPDCIDQRIQLSNGMRINDP